MNFVIIEFDCETGKTTIRSLEATLEKALTEVFLFYNEYPIIERVPEAYTSEEGDSYQLKLLDSANKIKKVISIIDISNKETNYGIQC